jgi:CspA family cold shock protein
MEGRIKRIMRDRGFGFIRTQSGQQVFFHRTNLRDVDFVSLEEGEAVEFELQPGEKGLRATSIRIARMRPAS